MGAEVAHVSEAARWVLAAGSARVAEWVRAAIAPADMAAQRRERHRCRGRVFRHLVVRVVALLPAGIAWQIRARLMVIFQRQVFSEAQA